MRRNVKKMSKLFSRHSFILVVLIVFVLVFSIGLFAWMKMDLNKKQQTLDALNEQLAQVQRDNENLEYLINEADEAQLYERLARERGYAYPDEKIYYDVTPGK